MPFQYDRLLHPRPALTNAALRTVTGCTQYTHIRHLHDYILTLPIHEHLQLTPQNSNRKHNMYNIPYTNIQQHSKAKTHSLQQCPLHNKHAPYTVHTTHLLSRHLATRSNNKKLSTPSPHINSSEEILPRLTRRTLAQLGTK